MNAPSLPWTRRAAVAVLLASLVWCASSQAAAPKLSGDVIPTADADLVVHPINHATLALSWKDAVVYVDPVGGAGRFQGLPAPTLIVLTDIHGDHLDPATLTAIAKADTWLVAPPAAAEKLPAPLRARATVLTNGASTTLQGIKLEAIPAYNLSPDRKQFHTQGRGNGYVLTLGGKRIYLSGDTEDIPEMRSLRQIDVAFICMNLPYTMTVQQAADAIRAFRPKIVYPYHYRGANLETLKELLADERGVELRLRDWYAP